MAVYIVSDSCECVWPGVGGWEGLACHEVFFVCMAHDHSSLFLF